MCSEADEYKSITRYACYWYFLPSCFNQPPICRPVESWCVQWITPPFAFHSYSPENSTLSPLLKLLIRGAKSILWATSNVWPLLSVKMNLWCLDPSRSSDNIFSTRPSPCTWRLLCLLLYARWRMLLSLCVHDEKLGNEIPRSWTYPYINTTKIAKKMYFFMISWYKTYY